MPRFATAVSSSVTTNAVNLTTDGILFLGTAHALWNHTKKDIADQYVTEPPLSCI